MAYYWGPDRLTDRCKDQPTRPEATLANIKKDLEQPFAGIAYVTVHCHSWLFCEGVEFKQPPFHLKVVLVENSAFTFKVCSADLTSTRI